MGYTSHLRRYFIVITISSIILALLSLATPFIIKYATDWIVGIISGENQFNFEYLAVIVGLQLLVTLFTIIATDVGGWYGDIMAIKTRRQLSKSYFEHLLRLPQHYYDTEVTGKIINRLSRAIGDVTNFLNFFSNNLLQMLLTMAITIIILVIYSWPLAVLFLLFIPANLYLTTKTSGKWQRLEAEKNTNFDIASGRFAEVVGQMRLVKSFGSEKRELKLFDDRVYTMVGLTKQQSKHWHLMNALRGSIFGALFAVIYGVVFYQAAMRQISVGDMVLLITLIQQASMPLRNISFFVDNYQKAVANSKDFIIAMTEKPETDDSRHIDLTAGNAKIEYKNVNFSYIDGETVLNDISFTIEPGKKVALVGESGGGKSTISNILMRLYSPNGGTVVINGKDISEVSRSSLRASIATVFQDAALFSGTIRENIVYANPGASDKQVEAAAKAANAYDFISKLSHGLETEIGERGIKLSGGQKQRIAIARAVLKDAPILILDEATSSLDSRSEVLVQEALDRLMKNRTVMIIAHRLSTIAHVDTIVTLKDGTINEIGSPSKLSKTNGIYSQLLELQLGSTEQARKRLAEFDLAS